TIIGTHDQYFTLPAINTTYDRVASAGTHPRFRKNILLAPNENHGVIEGRDDLDTLRAVIGDVHAWLRYSFDGAAAPPETPTVTIGAAPPTRAPALPDNILYFAEARDLANFAVTSKMYYRAGELSFCGDFVPLIEHLSG